jgi:apolipoprotein N-acyltransferase
VALAAALLGACWVLIEVARSVQYLGGPFGVLGAAPWRVPPLLAPAAVGGVWLVSFLAVATNVGLAALVAPRTAVSGRLAGVLVAVAAIAVGPVVAAVRSAPRVEGGVRAAVVQVGVIDPSDQRFDEGERITRTLAGRRDVDLVVWGESSVGADLQHDPALLGRVEALARSTGAPLLVNVDARQSPIAGQGGPGTDKVGTDKVGIYKRSLLVTGSGVDGGYDKQRLVPFGEYIPFRRALGWLTRLTPAATEDRRRGTHLVWLDLPGTRWRIGPLICFESAFPDMSRRLAAGGADVIVVQSSTTTFQRSWAPDQHASLAAVRAVETGRPVLHATLSGTSAAFDGRGRLLLWMPTDVTGAREVTIPITAGTAPYVRLGDWVPVACAAALAVWAAAAISQRGLGRSRSPGHGDL